jgi:hypothetical protein
MRIPEAIQRELDKCETTWEIRDGKKHRQVWVAGKFVGIFATNAKKSTTAGRGAKGLCSAIQKAAREALDGSVLPNHRVCPGHALTEERNTL